MARRTDDKSGEPILTIVRTFDAPRDLVFRAWTEPAHFVRWWGPRIFHVPHCTIDLRVGGELHYCMSADEGEAMWKKGIWVKGVYREIDPPRRLSFLTYFTNEKGESVPPGDYGMPEAPMEMLITLDLEERDGVTVMTATQSLPESVARKLGAYEGWGESLDKLSEYLAKSAA